MIKRPSYASVTATLALFVALGGTSYAAQALPRASSAGSARLAAAPMAYAHITVNKIAVLDKNLSYGVNGVTDAGLAGSQNRRLVCVYGNFTPHAVSASKDLAPDNSPDSTELEVEIGQPWMIVRCPQSSLGRVVAVITLPVTVTTHGVRKTAAAGANAPPRPQNAPAFAQTGAWLVFF
jgi:hypothetical protein